jgi:hypothetical protein
MKADYKWGMRHVTQKVGFPSAGLKGSDWAWKSTISFVIFYGFRIRPLIFKARGQTKVIFEQGAEGYISTSDSNSKKITEKIT